MALSLQLWLPPSPTTTTKTNSQLVGPISLFPRTPHQSRTTSSLILPLRCSHSQYPIKTPSSYDPELRLVLELATDAELYDLQRILFGPSYFSPLLKSIIRRNDVDDMLLDEGLDTREDFVEAIESRFFFLAADARSMLRGWRPTYRNVLLSVRKKLNIPCSTKLSTEDLEAEIFLYLVKINACEESGTVLGLREEIESMILKGSGMFTLSKIYELLVSKLTGKVFIEAANYQIKKEIVKKVGQLAALSLESRVAFLTAERGFVRAASRYLGFRSMMSLLGPLLWGTFLADVVIQMLGTDYARILRAIYEFAQIRITRTYRLSSEE